MSFEQRPYILLEVLLAFVLVIMCAFPIFSIYVGVSRAEHQASLKQHYRHIANDVYSHVKQKLYSGEITLSDFKLGHYQQTLSSYILQQDSRRSLSIQRNYDLFIYGDDPNRNRLLLRLNVTLAPQDTVITYFISAKT